MTFNNDLDRDLATLEAYRTFRQEASALGVRHFLEVFNPNAPTGLAPEQVGAFVNDSIIRALAGVTREQRPLFLKVAYNGSDVLAELAGYDPSLRGRRSRRVGGYHTGYLRASASGRETWRSGRTLRPQNPARGVATGPGHLMRPVLRGELSPADAVRSYHDALAKAEIAPDRELGADLQVTDPVLGAE